MHLGHSPTGKAPPGARMLQLEQRGDLSMAGVGEKWEENQNSWLFIGFEFPNLLRKFRLREN